MRVYENRFDRIIACCFSEEDREIYMDMMAVGKGPGSKQAAIPSLD
jgi:hypothetical protein